MAKSVSGHDTETHKFNQTVAIISAYVGHNTVSADALPGLIRSVYSTLETLTLPQPTPEAFQEKTVTPPASKPLDDTVLQPQQALSPAVEVKRSVFPDYIICLEDGQKTKMLKSYLRKHFNMSPEDYRTRWGLPPEYPMVAPNYSAQRAAIAKRTSLGRRSPGAKVKGIEDRRTRTSKTK
ncbi:Ros/MucR family transcriptional regulator [Acetobacter indonesiensis NRIC 0313]|uniref:MucR family transcriptional regulator n=1 Tax=Acetobacter indonesiensis TaxID=104101 RepID=A0A6N3T659_9PROT|nr:MucR family transcriptional regulator [Acetobacter indonesiensis]GAN63266.1 transcriptional regulator Ros/MucR [Acetobacter indonesiensis]GBQ61773.1 Ros/MucR family transcriptional regulator [Acetobacter indonesiensis NRIC 0313]GEN03905.1 MucR family transcriptional regulator [Acetobacter indonesiensis]